VVCALFGVIVYCLLGMLCGMRLVWSDNVSSDRAVGALRRGGYTHAHSR